MQRDGILGCGSMAAYPFFISFYIINSIVILDLSIGVFINALQEARKYNEILFGTRQLELFKNLWSQYDPDGTGWISVYQMLMLIFELPCPYGMGKQTPEYSNVFKFEHVHEKLKKESNYLLQTKGNMDEDEFWKCDEVKKKFFDGSLYYVNESKGFAIKDIRS